MKLKGVVKMFFLVPIVSAAVESVLASESVSMFVAGAASAVQLFSRD